MTDPFKYFAFISYNSKDTAWGKRLQRKLEHYRMPATLCSEHGWKRKPMNPVFFAPTDIQPGGLTEELQERLKASKNLIVICSPNSAQSEWVGKEIEFFHNLGRTKNIHFFIVDGTPHSSDPKTECFNPVVEKLGLPEILGANIHEQIYRQPWLNKERAYVQLISKLLGVEFDAIWQRHRRRLVQKATAWSVGSVAIIAALLCVWRMSQPFDVEIRLNEASVHNDDLPPLKDAVVTMHLDNETKSDTIRSLESSIVFSNIPHRLLNKPIQMTVTCRDFLSLDTTMILSSTMTANLFRDPAVYGHVHFCTWNSETETGLANTTLQVEGYTVTTDEKGCASIVIPLEAQKMTYRVSAPVPLQNNILTMPSGENDVLLTE
jgi:hypothetical protein